jgi:hypothetical protein
MALNDPIILETVVTPVYNGTIIRIQIADAPLRDGLMEADVADIHIDLTTRLPNAANARLASIHREAINRAQEVLSRLAQQAAPCRSASCLLLISAVTMSNLIQVGICRS